MRSPKDYAIEHAEYMAQGAEQLLDAINGYLTAQESEDEDAIAEARENLSEYTRGLRGDIYEFRKRRDRARGQATTMDGKVPLPEPAFIVHPRDRPNERKKLFTEEQMHEYAEAVADIKTNNRALL